MLFDPFELDTSVTPVQIRAALCQRDFTRAILMAFRLNERKLLQEALESVPWDESEPGPGLGGPAGPRGPCGHTRRPGVCTCRAVGASLRTGSLRAEWDFLLLFQLRSSAPPCLTCTWRRRWNS